MTEVKEGKITRVIFNNEANGYTVALFETADEQFTLTGSFHAVNANARYRISGFFKTHKRYGEQFNVEQYEELVPDDAEGIRAFLSAGTIKGIGPKTAALIVETFGKETFDVIEETPEKLLAIRGIGAKTLHGIIESYRESKEFTQISLALGEMGVEPAQAVRIYKLYGAKAVEIIRENPYTLVEDVYGITFRKADQIAVRIGIEQESGFRVQSGIKYALQVHAGGGSTFVPRDVLLEEAIKLLEVGSALVEENLVQLAFQGQIQADVLDEMPVVYQCGYFQAEQRVTANLKRLMEAEVAAIPMQADNLIADAEARTLRSLSEEQRLAVKTALDGRITIITGGPGTGKTTIINVIVKILERCEIAVAIAAPTGRAAKRITETSGMPALTIHRLLEYVYAEEEEVMEFGRNAENPLEETAIIIDEASMVDLLLMDGLLDAIKSGSRLIIVGDADQLPSVGAGNVLRDMIESEYIPTIRLKEIFRQASESKIVVNAHLINSGEYPEPSGRDGDFFLMQRDHEEEILTTIKELVGGRLARYYDFVQSGRDIQVITPTRKGALGTGNLNAALQEVLNPAQPERRERTFGNKIFREGDKVMQIRNNYSMEWRQLGSQSGTGVFNGDMGIIEAVDNEAGTVVVNFEERFVTYGTEDLDELEPAYAITVHKSQGSEFPVVIVPMTWFPPMLMTRKLLYTAVTRGKKLVVLVGVEERMRRMIDNDRADARFTGLKARLQQQDLGVF